MITDDHNFKEYYIGRIQAISLDDEGKGTARQLYEGYAVFLWCSVETEEKAIYHTKRVLKEEGYELYDFVELLAAVDYITTYGNKNQDELATCIEELNAKRYNTVLSRLTPVAWPKELIEAETYYIEREVIEEALLGHYGLNVRKPVMLSMLNPENLDDWNKTDFEELLFGDKKDKNGKPLRTYYLASCPASIKFSLHIFRFLIRSGDVPYKSLYKFDPWTDTEDTESISPYLIDLTESDDPEAMRNRNDLLARLGREYVGQACGWFMRSSNTLEELWSHWRKFTHVQDEMGKFLMFPIDFPNNIDIYANNITQWQERAIQLFGHPDKEIYIPMIAVDIKTAEEAFAKKEEDSCFLIKKRSVGKFHIYHIDTSKPPQPEPKPLPQLFPDAENEKVRNMIVSEEELGWWTKKKTDTFLEDWAESQHSFNPETPKEDYLEFAKLCKREAKKFNLDDQLYLIDFINLNVDLGYKFYDDPTFNEFKDVIEDKEKSSFQKIEDLKEQEENFTKLKIEEIVDDNKNNIELIYRDRINYLESKGVKKSFFAMAKDSFEKAQLDEENFLIWQILSIEEGLFFHKNPLCKKFIEMMSKEKEEN